MSIMNQEDERPAGNSRTSTFDLRHWHMLKMDQVIRSEGRHLSVGLWASTERTKHALASHPTYGRTMSDASTFNNESSSFIFRYAASPQQEETVFTMANLVMSHISFSAINAY
jgi:hypothetical protein